jgi:hypothetical protein
MLKTYVVSFPRDNVHHSRAVGVREDVGGSTVCRARRRA